VLAGGTIGGVDVYGGSADALMTRASWRPNPNAGGLTLGFWERRLGHFRCLMIRGDAPEGTSCIVLIPELGIGFFVTGNRPDATFTTGVSRAMIDRILRDRAAASPHDSDVRPALSAPVYDGTGVEGEYFIERFSSGNLESLAKWDAWIRVRRVGDRAIRVTDSQGGDRDYEMTGPGLYRPAGGDGFIAFSGSPSIGARWAITPDGMGYGNGLGFAQAFRKAAWYERVVVKRTALLIALGTALGGLVLWPLGLLLGAAARRIRKQAPRSPRSPAAARAVSMVASALLLGGTMGTVVLLSDRDALVSGVPAWGYLPTVAYWAFVLGALGTAGLAAGAWAKRWLGIAERCWVTILSLALVLVVPFLWDWGLLSVPV